MEQQNLDSLKQIWQNIKRYLAFVYILAVFDLGTTTYGIFVNALDVKGVLGWFISAFFALLFLWFAKFSKDNVYKFISWAYEPSKSLLSGVGLEAIAELIPLLSYAFIAFISLGFIFVDFATSWLGVSNFIPVSGSIGAVVKFFTVFALVFCTVYIVYIDQPFEANKLNSSDQN